MAYNPNILREALRARSLSPSQLSRRLGINREHLESELQREPQPRQGLLNDIAKELALPAFVFYMERTPPFQHPIPDFRSENPSPTALSRSTLRTIQLAEGIQKTVRGSVLPGARRLPPFDATTQTEIEKFALYARKFFNITLKDQAKAKDARAFYILCRRRIEKKKIFVLHDSFPADDGSGFCLSDPQFPVIVINTQRQTRGRRLFTLIHELAHVLLQQSGISDPFVQNNRTEKQCNYFAASFLVPRGYAEELLGHPNIDQRPDREDVRWASRRLKISQEASVLRLEQLGIYRAGSYQRWRSLTQGDNPDFAEKGGGGTQAPPQEKVKLAKYGFRFAEAFNTLLENESISEIDLYRISGLKPKFQRAYFDYTNTITEAELQALELDDE